MSQESVQHVEIKKTSKRTWEVSTIDGVYDVYFAGGVLRCTCPAYNRMVKKYPDYACRHIVAVMRREDMEI